MMDRLISPESLSQPPASVLPTSIHLAQAILATPKKRSLSDSEPLHLDPSPEFKERPTKSQDDDSLVATPTRTPRRVDLSARGLSLQMPARDPAFFHFHSPGTGLGLQSPSTDQRDPYGSPSSVLPRHSRGMDFSRAATNLHHSTLADQSSPDSSPTISQKPMLPPSRRNSMLSMALDSPRVGSSWSWSLPSNGSQISVPRSVGSTNAMTSEASSSSSDDEDTLMDQDGEEVDAMISTPQVSKIMGGPGPTPYEPKSWTPEASTPNQMQSPSAFSSYRRNILGRRSDRTMRHHPYRNGLRTSSPEPFGLTDRPPSNGSLVNDAIMKSPRSRRESLGLGIGDTLHITSSNEDADDGPSIMPPPTPGVVRRPVTRRSNMLPRSKNFARIRAALQEEGNPIESDVQRESEVVKQVRGNEVGLHRRPSALAMSPDLTPAVPNLASEISEMTALQASGVTGGLASGSLADLRSESLIRQRKRSSTPPPFLPGNRQRSSSGMSSISEDNGMDSPGCSTPPSSTMMAMDGAIGETKPSIENGPFFHPPNLPSAAEMSRKINNKRRRDDDFDINSFKRRAVSPGMSAHSSPVLGQSPVNSGIWPARLSREGSVPGSASNSNSNSTMNSTEERDRSSMSQPQQPTPVMGPKRVGLQGMTDTNESLMSMTLE